MKLLVWHWGRRGGGPLFAARLAEAVNDLPGQHAVLSLAAGAEILHQPNPPPCLWPEPTYNGTGGYLLKRALSPALTGRTFRKLQTLQPDMAICAMPALLDGRILAGLKRARIPYAVIVHDAAAHPGDALSFAMLDQRRLLRGAAALVTLSEHVANDLAALNIPAPIIRLWHPAFAFGPPAAPPLAHGGKPRLLFFGRLLAYKGIDLLAAALTRFGPDLPFDLRICGDGPPSPALAALAARPGVTLERRWIAEAELPGLLAWSDGLILPYREASQSGVAAAAFAAGRYVLATRVGGLAELTGKPGVTLCPPSAEGIAAGFTSMFSGPPPPLVDAAADWRLMASRLLAALSSVSAN
jgi:glycosyltransferase involved in cell wall biosynthesis